MIKSRMCLVLYLVGWEDGGSFLDQSQSKFLKAFQSETQAVRS